MFEISHLDSFAPFPRGYAELGFWHPNQGSDEVMWFLRESNERLAAMQGKQFKFCCHLAVEENVLLVICMIALVTPKPGNIWITWLNSWAPGREKFLAVLCRQKEMTIACVDDDGIVTPVMTGPNRPQPAWRKAVGLRSKLPSWSIAQFERARESYCQKHRDLLALWNHALAARGGRARGAGDEVASWELASCDNMLAPPELTLRGLHEHIQSLLDRLAPFSGAVSRRALADYAQNLRLQPSLRHVPFHLWDSAIQQGLERGLLRTHPAHAECLAIAPRFTALARERLGRYSPPPQRQALEFAFHSTYARLASGMRAPLDSPDEGQREAALTSVGLEYENLAMALEYGLSRRLSVSNIYALMQCYLARSEYHQRGVDLGERLLPRLAKHSGDLGRIRVLHDIAERQKQLGETRDAEASLRKAVALAGPSVFSLSQDDKTCMGVIHAKLGKAAIDRRCWKTARKHHRAALAIALELGGRKAQAGNRLYLARIADALGDGAGARRQGVKSLELYVALGDRPCEGNVAYELAGWLSNERRYRAAEKYCRRALAIFVELGNKGYQADAHCTLGRLAALRKRNKAAVLQFRQAIALFREGGKRNGMATCYYEAAGATGMRGNVRMARKYYLRAIKLSRAVEDRATEGIAYMDLGRLAAGCRRWPKARRCFLMALELLRDGNEPRRTAELYLGLGDAAYEQDQWDEGREHFAAALRALREAADQDAIARALSTVAPAWHDRGDAKLPATLADALAASPGDVVRMLRKALAAP